MPLKILVKLHDQLGGFSDYWIDNAASINAPTPVATLRNYLVARMGFSGAQTFWDYVRLSTVGTVGTPRQVVSYYPSDAGFNGLTPNGTFFYTNRSGTEIVDDSDYRGTAFNMRKFSADAYSGRIFFRGIPDSTVVTGGTIFRGGNFGAALTALQTAITTPGWGWSGTTKMPGFPVPITGITPLADGTLTITTTGQAFPVGPPMPRVAARISGQVTPGNVNGYLTLQVTGPNTATTINRIGITPFVAGNGRLFLYMISFHALSRLTVVGATQRRAGVPFGTSRGRSRKRVRG